MVRLINGPHVGTHLMAPVIFEIKEWIQWYWEVSDFSARKGSASSATRDFILEEAPVGLQPLLREDYMGTAFSRL